MSQSNNLENDYRTNLRKFNFKVRDIQYVFIGHTHLDHVGLLPLLVKRGLECPIIVPDGARRILKDMLTDSAMILYKEAETLSLRRNKIVEPVYTINDVNAALQLVEEFPFDKVIKLNDHIKFRYVNSGHIICGAQIELWFTEGSTTKKLLYTSDLGNYNIEKYYVPRFEPVAKADVVIGESTYAAKGRPQATLAQREKDKEKIKSIIIETCVYNKSKVLIPCFALDRLQEVLTEIYNLFKDEDFKIPVIVDTPLGLRYTKSYFHILSEEKSQLLKSALEWRNVIQVGDYPESKHWAEENQPCVILASSGMLNAGRALVYASKILSNYKNHIIFIGYASEGSLAWKIKSDKTKKWLDIGGEKCRNNCAITSLHSYSSHMQYKGLLHYYSTIQCNTIILVHGRMEDKAEFAVDLSKEFNKQAKSTRIIISNKSLVYKV